MCATCCPWRLPDHLEVVVCYWLRSIVMETVEDDLSDGMVVVVCYYFIAE
jgi:hypothetical protein